MNAWLRQYLARTIVNPLQRESARLLTKAALFALALFVFLIGLGFLTAALFIWIDGLAGALAAALCVAGAYFGIGIIAIFTAIYGGKARLEAPARRQMNEKRPRNVLEENDAEHVNREAEITEAIAPIIEVLRSLGLKREELALLAGAELAKTLPPLTLAGFAVVCGFLIGRMAKWPFGIGMKESP